MYTKQLLHRNHAQLEGASPQFTDDSSLDQRQSDFLSLILATPMWNVSVLKLLLQHFARFGLYYFRSMENGVVELIPTKAKLRCNLY